ncbi:MAG: MATE family efflux transporter [Rhizobiaceae bacterium]|nr:MATE family efflux transporter [Rhizobiaceae bacterium]
MVMAISVPMAFASLSTPLLGIIDTAVVGQFGNASLIGGLAIGSTVFGFVFASFNFLRSGTSGLVAQAFGQDDIGEQQAVFWRAIVIALALGILLIAASQLIKGAGLLFMQPSPDVAEAMSTYLSIRLFSSPMALVNYAVLGVLLGRGRATLGLSLQFLLNGVNMAMSVWLGLVLEWGVAGVAWGTVIAESVAAAAGMVIVTASFRRHPLPTIRLILDRAALGRLFSINRDIMIRSFLLLTAFAFFTRTGAQLGPVALAANAILFKFYLVASFFSDGFTTAAEHICGRAIGANYPPAFHRGIRLTLIWSMGLAVALALVFYFVGGHLIAIMTNAPDVRAEALTYLPWVALTAVSGFLAFQLDGVYIGATWSHDMRNTMALALICYLVILFAVLPTLGNHGLWLAFNIFLLTRGLLMLAVLPRRTRMVFAEPAAIKGQELL